MREAEALLKKGAEIICGVAYMDKREVGRFHGEAFVPNEEGQELLAKKKPAKKKTKKPKAETPAETEEQVTEPEASDEANDGLGSLDELLAE